MTGAISAAEILAQLDDCAQRFEFPMLDNVYLHNADVRVSAFRAPSEWLIVFQEIAVFQETSLENVVSCYGNRLGERCHLEAITPFTAAPGASMWTDDREFTLDLGSFDIAVGGQIRHFAPSAADLAAAGVHPSVAMPEPARLLRFLAHAIPEELFAPDERLLPVCGRTAERELVRLLQIDDWHHPDLAAGEAPSDSACLRSLAQAVASWDPQAYVCAEATFNTHWSQWAHPDS